MQSQLLIIQTSDDSQKTISNLNNLAEFRKTLNTAMIVLDKK